MKERIQERLENEFNIYKEQVLASDKQSVFDKSYETAIKQTGKRQDFSMYFLVFFSGHGGLLWI